MDHIIIDCETGDVQAIPMTADEVRALEQAQAEAQASQDAAQRAADDTRASEQQQQIAAAQSLVDTAANPAQATALTNFIRAVGVPI